jgi:hypothetical protein
MIAQRDAKVCEEPIYRTSEHVRLPCTLRSSSVRATWPAEESQSCKDFSALPFAILVIMEA